MWEAFLLLGAVSLHGIIVGQPQEKGSQLLPQRQRGLFSCTYVLADLAQNGAERPGAENLVPAVGCRIGMGALPCLSCYLNSCRVYKDFPPETHPEVLLSLLLGAGWMSVFHLPAITHNRKPMKLQAGC